MVKNQLPVIVAILLAVGIRLYLKYVRNNKAKSGTESKQSGNTIGSSSKEDEYEPYSKK